MFMKWLIALILGTAFLFSQFAVAQEEEHEGGKIKIPAALSDVRQEIKDHELDLGKIITDKKLDKVHEEAYEIRDLVNALPAKSGDLSADKLEAVQANARYVAAMAKRLDVSGDAGDQTATEANFKKLQEFLKTIEMQYPK